MTSPRSLGNEGGDPYMLANLPPCVMVYRQYRLSVADNPPGTSYSATVLGWPAWAAVKSSYLSIRFPKSSAKLNAPLSLPNIYRSVL